MKKAFFLLAGVLFLMTSCHESMDERASRECREYTERYCPTPISETVINDSLTFEQQSRTIHYYYTLQGAADTTGLPESTIKKDLLDGIRNSPELKRYKEEGYNFRYTYFSTKEKGRQLFDFVFTSEDYK